MKKIIALVIIVTLLCAGCGTKDYLLEDKFRTDEYLPEYDMQNQYAGSAVAMCENDTTCYFVMSSSPYIRFYDKETGQGDILCGKPECTHENEECNAHAIGLTGISLYDNKLWFVAKNKGVDGLWNMNLDGTGRQMVQKLGIEIKGSTTIRLHRGYMYIGIIEDEVEKAEPTYSMKIQQIQLGEENAEPVMIYELSGRKMTPRYFYQLYGNKMYILSVDYNSFSSNTYQLTLTEFDVANRESEVLYEEKVPSMYWISGCWVNAEGFYYYGYTTQENGCVVQTKKYDFVSGQVTESESTADYLGFEMAMGPDGSCVWAGYNGADAYGILMYNGDGELLREEIIEKDAGEMGEVDGWRIYGFTEEGALVELSWRRLDENGDPLQWSAEAMIMIPADPAKEAYYWVEPIIEDHIAG